MMKNIYAKKNATRHQRFVILVGLAIPVITGLAAFSKAVSHPILSQMRMRTEKLFGQAKPPVQENHAPVVKIINPAANSIYPENAQVRYEVAVSDKEDGETKFQEIPPNEIFLEVRYFASGSKALAASKQALKNDPPGLETIKASNCLNCHAFNAKLIGPSFYDIGKRYSFSKSHVDTLSRRILEGTTGVWGSIKMPTHPELTKGQATDIVGWILKNASDPAVDYYMGTEGSFRVKVPPASGGKDAVSGSKRTVAGDKSVSSAGKGILVLTASYTDHGVKDKPTERLKGQETILLKIQ
ncbi:MAG: hypothetical protein P4L51_25520 [Puia sp.]|nr:hypothetical protein [Puia sp.]